MLHFAPSIMVPTIVILYVNVFALDLLAVSFALWLGSHNAIQLSFPLNWYTVCMLCITFDESRVLKSMLKI